MDTPKLVKRVWVVSTMGSRLRRAAGAAIAPVSRASLNMRDHMLGGINAHAGHVRQLARLTGFERNTGIWVCGAIMREIAEKLARFVGRGFFDVFVKPVDVL